ncbi:hypothetical protein GCM10008090_27860 [Arenicella chitinivorans]|uniref:Uncharacterized protein n=1 Tax=Arenicella chitinivorans TaxID=1329800 RepID=A0A918RYW9_9GAMM|nr:hypothetical protein GCM10008090_27860 [Arenicella chitinivorans]
MTTEVAKTGTIIIVLAILSQLLIPFILYATYVQNAEGLVMAYGMILMIPHVIIELILLITLIVFQFSGKLKNVHIVLKVIFFVTLVSTVLSLLYQP